MPGARGKRFGQGNEVDRARPHVFHRDYWPLKLIRRGVDAFKALALGADCVGLGTQLVVACAAAGRDGVRHMMRLLQEELERVMCLTGCPTVSAIQPSILHVPR